MKCTGTHFSVQITEPIHAIMFQRFIVPLDKQNIYIDVVPSQNIILIDKKA